MSWKNYAKWYKQKDAWQRAPMKEKDADPDDISIDNAYKTRWIWYHTILGIQLFIIIILHIATFTLLAIKL